MAVFNYSDLRVKVPPLMPGADYKWLVKTLNNKYLKIDDSWFAPGNGIVKQIIHAYQ